eukprot:191460-Pleurochrysis_carterae.AAC.1
MNALRADTVGSVIPRISCECVSSRRSWRSSRSRRHSLRQTRFSGALFRGQRIGSACRRACDGLQNKGHYFAISGFNQLRGND